jgi:hypothetical protein
MPLTIQYLNDSARRLFVILLICDIMSSKRFRAARGLVSFEQSRDSSTSLGMT